jgi:hypothetical protein
LSPGHTSQQNPSWGFCSLGYGKVSPPGSTQQFLDTSFPQACRCCCLSTCVSVLWLQHSVTSHVALRVSWFARRMTAGASAAPLSQNAIVLMLTSRLWKTACFRSRIPGPLTTGSLRSQVSNQLAQNSFLPKRSSYEVQNKNIGNSA